MPIINVKLVEGTFSTGQKRALLPKLTDAIDAVHPGLRDVTFVTIEEIKSGDWGVAGEPVTVEVVEAHAKANLAQEV